MLSYIRDYPVFKKFVYISLSAHIILFLLILLSPVGALQKKVLFLLPKRARSLLKPRFRPEKP
jgi:hypothetical protein